MKPIQVYNFKPLLWLGFAGITLRPFIIWGYSKAEVPAHLVRHELCHFEQQKRLGLKFYYLYLKEYFTLLWQYVQNAHWIAYREISFKQEAVRAEREIIFTDV